MQLSTEKLKEILVGPGHLTPAEFETAEEKAASSGKGIEDILMHEGILSDNQLGKIIADTFGWQFVDLGEERISVELFHIIPEIVARAQHAIVFDQNESESRIKIALADPTNYEMVKQIEKMTGCHAEVYYATPHAIESILHYYKSDFDHVIAGVIEDLTKDPTEEKMVELVDLFLDYAYQSRASDVHFEPMKEDVVVRFRVDGIMYEVSRYPKDLHDRIVFRIKILSRLRTDEHAAPQDGKFQFKKDTTVFDIRVSILQITTGENIVLRILAEHVRRLLLEEIGLSDRDAEILRRAIRKPYGMVLSSGPTGAGKTTLLYALIQILNQPEVNIVTIEDPVEYDIDGVHQIQVNEKTGLTFANGLRSVVRQDPDIIFVGEMRDAETAGIAINAALTGHILLSTIHANDASTVFPRLIDLKIEPFLIASSLNVVVGQRLVRKICSRCIHSYLLNDQDIKLFADQAELIREILRLTEKKDIMEVRFYQGAGCKTCGGTGYFGRTGIFEVLEVTDPLKILIVQKSSSADIQAKAIASGMTTMLEDGLIKAFRGITTLTEIIRVTKA